MRLAAGVKEFFFSVPSSEMTMGLKQLLIHGLGRNTFDLSKEDRN
jgi:hypothetical protein